MTIITYLCPNSDAGLAGIWIGIQYKDDILPV